MTLSPVEEGKTDIVFNQTITQGFQIKIVTDLLQQLSGNTINFTTYRELHAEIQRIYETCKNNQYSLEVVNQNNIETYKLSIVQ